MTQNPSIRMYVNMIKTRNTFKIRTEYYFKVLTPEAMKLLGSTESKITKDKNGKNLPHLEITGVALVHSNVVSNDYGDDSRVLYTFISNKSLITNRQILDISPKNFIFLKTFNSLKV